MDKLNSWLASQKLFIYHLHKKVNVITLNVQLVCIFQVGLATEDGVSNDTYRPLLAKLPGGQITLEEAYAAMDKIMKEVISYTDVSRHYTQDFLVD